VRNTKVSAKMIYNSFIIRLFNIYLSIALRRKVEYLIMKLSTLYDTFIIIMMINNIMAYTTSVKKICGAYQYMQGL
jgi:hypothetical protein